MDYTQNDLDWAWLKGVMLGLVVATGIWLSLVWLSS